MKKSIRLAVCAVATIGLASCSSSGDRQAESTSGGALSSILDDSRATSDQIIVEARTDVELDGPSDSEHELEEAPDLVAEPDESDPDLFTIGESVVLGDWTVTITGVERNADTAIAEANMYNDKPAGHYLLVTYEALYNGQERKADVESDLTWQFTTASSEVLDESWEVSPYDAEDRPTEARSGGKIAQQVVFDVPRGGVKGGILSVEAYDENLDTIYADFGL